MDHETDPTAQDTLRPGTMLGRYEIRRLIGRGGMGSVYEAIHTDLKKRVAVKTLLPSLAANSDARMRFLREGEAASRIQHPHVVNVTDVGAEGSTIYLVMEYLEGEDLAKLIARQGALSVAQTADIMLPVAAAISTAHEQGVVHRDLKPENVFLALSTFSRIQPKVLDFGISKVSGDRNTMVLTGTGATFGTMFYLPPEQLQGARQADAKSDQYALGTILYECVTGQRAFERENLYAVMKDIAEGRYIPPRERRADLPEAMERVIMRAMSLQPVGRFSSVLEMGAALLPFAGPNARVVWTPFFSGASAAEENELPRTPSPLVAGGTMVLPPDASGPFGRLAVTPPPRSARGPAQSTLGHATGESRMPSGVVPDLRRSRAPLVTVLGLAAAAGIAALALLPRDSMPSWLSFAGTSPQGNSAFDDDKVTAPAEKPPEKRTFRVEIETDPRGATLELDGRPVGVGALDQRLPLDGTEHVLVARAPGYRETTVRFTDRSPPHLLTLDPPPVVRPTPPPESVEARPTTNAGDRVGGGGKVKKNARRRRDVASSGESDRGGEKKRRPRPAGGSGLMPNGAPIIE